MLINLPKDAQLFIFAKVMDKIIALCYLTVIFLISDNSFFPVLFSYWISYLSRRNVVRSKVTVCEGLASVKCGHSYPVNAGFIVILS